ncbi:hypothetical protein BH11MYX1_BH11MYX1_17980 [soil metagenome]
MRSLIVVWLLELGCGKGAQKKQDDWHRTPLAQRSEHAGGVDFEIALPEDWAPRAAPDEGWGPTTGEPIKRPFVTVQNVSADLASSLESAISSAGAQAEFITRKETRADGYQISEAHDPRMIKATTFTRVGVSLLWCTASQTNDDGIPQFTETKQVLQKICDSVTPH